MSNDEKIIEADNIFDVLMLAKGSGIFKNVRIGKTLGNKTYMAADIIDVTDRVSLDLFLDASMNFGPAVSYNLIEKRSNTKKKDKASLKIDFAITQNMNDLYNGLIKNGFNPEWRPKLKFQFGISLGF